MIGVTGPVLADNEEEARDALAILDTCPVADRAIAASPYLPADFADLVAASRVLFPDGNRFAVDNMWTSAPVATSCRDCTGSPTPCRRSPLTRCG